MLLGLNSGFSDVYHYFLFQKAKFHFLVANAKFLLDDEEHFQEQMRERLRHFKDIGRPQDFWLLYEPEFLANYPAITKRLSRPAVALISTDEVWITYVTVMLLVLFFPLEPFLSFLNLLWLKAFLLIFSFMKLRLDRVLRGELEGTLSEALSSKSVDVSFEKPKEWVAPYSKYEGDWWIPFLPPNTQA